jgi:hypothetical protein
MNNGLHSDLTNVINNLCNEMCDQDEMIQINHLEIDLGEIPFERLHYIMPEKCYSAFKEKLYDLSIPLKKNESVIEKSSLVEIHEIVLLQKLLATGNLPWQAGKPKDFSLNAYVLQLLEKYPVELKEMLLDNLSDVKFTERLVAQLRIEVLKKVLILFGISETDIAEVKNVLEQVAVASKKTVSQQDLQLYSIKIIFNILNKRSFKLSEDQIKTLLTEQIISGLNINPEVQVVEEILTHEIIKEIHSKVNLLKSETINDDIAKDIFQEADDSVETEEKIFIENAGYILLSVFLPPLFKELQLLKEGKFTDKHSQHKALFLLHFLGTGENTAPEYVLQLNKILCGIAPGETIPLSIILSEKETNECEQLLKDMIEHWAVLKNSSIEGLRNSFLMRDGLLSFHDDHWLLQVEKKGYDALMESIPWSWQTIKFDWMNTYIEVEW